MKKKTEKAPELAKMLAPLVEMLNVNYGHCHSGLFITETPESLDALEVFIDVIVTERDAEIFGRVIATLLEKGGLSSVMYPSDMDWDPIEFSLQKKIKSDAYGTSTSCRLVAMTSRNYNKRAAKRQVALLHGILADPRNLFQEAPSALSLSELGSEVAKIAA